MGLNFNNSGELTFRGTGLVKKQLLKRGNYKLVAALFGQPFTQPNNATLTAKWSRYENFPTADAPLSEGITPPGRKLSRTDVTATLQQYGDWAPISDVLFDAHEDDLPTETVNLCADQMGETLEVVTIASLKSGSNVFYANNAGSRAAVNSPCLAGDFKRIERSLAVNKAEMITDRIVASQKVSTEGVDDSYIVFGHTDCKADIENMEGFTPVKAYADAGSKVHKAEIGALGSFRFLLTPLFSSFAAAATTNTGTTYLSSGVIPSAAAAPDVYSMIIVSKNSYGVMRMQGLQAVKPAVVRPKAVQGDPLGQQGFVSWKTYFMAMLLNTAWVVRYECAVTGQP